MADTLPYFKFYPSDFMGSGKVQMMSPAEVGIYIKLLCHSWQEGPLPDDPNRLWRIAGASPDEMSEAWPAVRKCFDKTPGGMVHPRLEKERADAQDRREKARAAANARHGNADAYAPAHADADADACADGSAPGDAPDMPYSESQSSQSTENTDSEKHHDVEKSGNERPGYAKRPTYTEGELLVEANEVLGMKALKPEDLQANRSILKRWLYKRPPVPSEEVYAAIHGLRWMVDTGRPEVSEWLSPQKPISLKALNNTETLFDQGDGKAKRVLFDVAVELYQRIGENEPRARGSGPKAIGDTIARLSA